MIFTTKMFEADRLTPLAMPDGTSLEEKVNVFTATKDLKDILDVTTRMELSGKFGTNERYFATVFYKE